MNRYKINFDKTVNLLTPWYLGGRRFILLVQSLIQPLQEVNDAFLEYAKEIRIETNMTSQIFPFTWYLNHKYSSYFADPTDEIQIISQSQPTGVAIYHESANTTHSFKIIEQSEGIDTTKLYLQSDNSENSMSTYSFEVKVPKLADSVDKAEFTVLLKSTIERYRLAGKSYKIEISE
jgi:hypothetical protein